MSATEGISQVTVLVRVSPARIEEFKSGFARVARGKTVTIRKMDDHIVWRDGYVLVSYDHRCRNENNDYTDAMRFIMNAMDWKDRVPEVHVLRSTWRAA